MKLIALIALLLASFPQTTWARSADLCALDGRRQVSRRIENPEKKTVQELLGVPSDNMQIVLWSKDWSNKKEGMRQVKKALQFRPRVLTSFPAWAEGILLTKRALIANIKAPNHIIHRIELAQDSYVCVSDSKHNYWYFRVFPVDGSPEDR